MHPGREAAYATHAKSQTRAGVVFVSLAASLSLAIGASGCLPNNGFTAKSVKSSSKTLTTIGDSTSADGAYFPCTNYSEANPDRAICVDCYKTVLTTNCGTTDLQGNTITEYAQCPDNTVKASFINLLNQCIASSIVAGFTCNTICSSGLVLDASSCTCITQTSSSSSGPAGGSTYIDVGQSDFGPPVVSASWPLGAVVGPAQVIAASNATVPALSSCSSTLSSLDPVALYIRNRGDTLPWQDVFSDPVVGPSGTNGAYLNMVTGTSSTTPPPAKPTTVALNNTAQAGAVFSFYSGAMHEFFPQDDASTPTNEVWNGSGASSHLFQGYPGYVQNISGLASVVGVTGGYGAGQVGWTKLQVLNDPISGDGKEPVIGVRESDGDVSLAWLQVSQGVGVYRPVSRGYEDSDGGTPTLSTEADIGSSTSRAAAQLTMAVDSNGSDNVVVAWTEEINTTTAVVKFRTDDDTFEFVGSGGRMSEIQPFATTQDSEWVEPAIAVVDERVLVAATEFKSTSNMDIYATWFPSDKSSGASWNLGYLAPAKDRNAQKPRVAVAKANGTNGGTSSNEALGLIGFQARGDPTGNPSLSHCYAARLYDDNYNDTGLGVGSITSGARLNSDSVTTRLGRNTRVAVYYLGTVAVNFTSDFYGLLAFCEEETAAASGKFQISYWLQTFGLSSLTQQSALTSVLEDARNPEVSMNRSGTAMVIYRSKPDGESNYRIKIARFVYTDYVDDSNGTTPSSTTELSDGSRDASTPKISVLDSGDALATWVEDNNGVNEVWVRKYTASASTWESPVLQASTSGTNSFASAPGADCPGTPTCASSEDSIIFQQGTAAPHSIVWNRRSDEPTWASQSTWRMPSFMARDRFGNVYVSDPAEKVIRVICYSTNSSVDNNWCNDAGPPGGNTAGYVYTIIGKPVAAGSLTSAHPKAADYTGGSTSVLSAYLSMPTGLAVDRYGNVVFADSFAHVVAVACGRAAGICSGRTVGNIYLVAGTYNSRNTTDYSGSIPGLNYPMGVDIETTSSAYSGTGSINVYIANAAVATLTSPDDTTEGFLAAQCGTTALINGHSTGCSVGGLFGLGAIRNNISQPIDAKVNWNGNLFYTSWGKGAGRTYQNGVHALCYDTSGHVDPCLNASLNADKLLAGIAPTGVSSSNAVSAYGSAGDGGYAYLARTTKPTTLAIGKAFGDDVHPLSDATDVAYRGKFRDNNIAFVESMWTNLTGASSGNAVRVICGSNTSTDVGNKGICLGRSKDTIYRMTGKYGLVPAYDGISYGRFGPDQSFAGLFGITYDKFKNVMVTTQSTASPPGQTTTYIDDHGIRSVMNVTLSQNAGGIKYTITDSNTLSATYCLRFKTLTSCYYKDEPQGPQSDGNEGLYETCSCEATPPFGATDMGAFWRAIGSNQQCGGR